TILKSPIPAATLPTPRTKSLIPFVALLAPLSILSIFLLASLPPFRSMRPYIRKSSNIFSPAFLGKIKTSLFWLAHHLKYVFCILEDFFSRLICTCIRLEMIFLIFIKRYKRFFIHIWQFNQPFLPNKVLCFFFKSFYNQFC